MPRTRLLLLVAALLLALAGASTARAGEYTLAYDFASDPSGWSGYVEPGYLLCGHWATAGCADVATDRIFASGAAQAIWGQGRWEWTAPPGTTIAGGALAYRTRMLHPQFYARVKTRIDGADWDASPALVTEQHTTALTDHVVALAAGFRQIGVSLYSHPAVAGLVTGVWDDYVTLVRLDVTVDDPTPPTIAWVGGPLVDGAWHNGDVCATIAFDDGQSGLGSAWLQSGAASSTWVAPRTGSQYQPGIPSARPTLCLTAAALGDGTHAGTLGGSDVSGGQASPLAFTVSIDATPPVATVASPGAVAADARPVVELDVSDGMSGVASVLAQIDGSTVPLDWSGGKATGRPAAALAYGAHTLAWTVTDAAGNRSQGSAPFAVPDSSAPSLGAPQPAGGSVLPDGAVLAAAVPVSDGESGVDPASLALTLDGAPVEHAWFAAGVAHGGTTSRLTAGTHHLALAIADRAGNTAHLAWDVSVAAGAGPAGSAPASAGSVAGGAAGAVPGTPRAAPSRGGITVRAVVMRLGATRPRSVIVRLRAKARLWIVLRVQCGTVVTKRRVRAGKHGIATTRVVCAGVATVRMVAKPGRLLVHIAARRLPLHLVVRPQSRTAPSVARVTGLLAEIHGRAVVLEALTAAGWRRVGVTHADAAGRFSTSFAIVRAGQFALRARVPALAAIACAPFVLTMR